MKITSETVFYTPIIKPEKRGGKRYEKRKPPVSTLKTGGLHEKCYLANCSMIETERPIKADSSSALRDLWLSIAKS